MILILNIYAWFNPINTQKQEFFDPCSKKNIKKYTISEKKKLDFFMDCGIINGENAHLEMRIKFFKTEKEEKDFIKEVNKRYK